MSGRIMTKYWLFGRGCFESFNTDTIPVLAKRHVRIDLHKPLFTVP